MKQFITIIKADLRKILRDKTMLFFLFMPLILLLVFRLGVPPLLNIFPEYDEFLPYVMMFAAAQSAIMFGFVTAFIMLDEKDENVISVIRILPIGSNKFILMRMLFASVMSFLGALIMLLFSGVIYLGFTMAVLLALQYALVAPIIILIVTTFAKNKIEGMAVFKLVDLFLLVPILSFLVDGFFQFLFSIIPLFWTYHSYLKMVQNEFYLLYYSVGFLIELL